MKAVMKMAMKSGIESLINGSESEEDGESEEAKWRSIGGWLISYVAAASKKANAASAGEEASKKEMWHASWRKWYNA